jgi:hypothetical protein
MVLFVGMHISYYVSVPSTEKRIEIQSLLAIQIIAFLFHKFSCADPYIF